MHIVKRFSTAVALFAFGQTLAGALPSSPPPDLAPRAVPCDTISKYTTDFWISNVYSQPPADVCLFYIEPLKNEALRYAAAKTLTTIWHIWECKYYNGDLNDVDNPLRCIFSNSAEKLTYFENMSRAMALTCTGDTTVMVRDVNDIPATGVFGRIERPTLEHSGLVNKITAIDINGNSPTVIWQRPTPKREDAPEPEARQFHTAELCYREKLQEWFGDLPW
ncbi:MAG: hypothetical protein M1813_007963 [Trichoglossum hirsutum]|nr:MAG: hypothetical protein M1813_007963 [Trichoglossum hirsutum]